MLSPPRYGTPRRPDRPTTGAHAAIVAELAGRPLQPWQRHVVDVAGELVWDDDANAIVHAYDTVTVSVARRAGKTVLTFTRCAASALDPARGVLDRRRFTFYTAQNGKAAAERFRNDWIPLVSGSPTLADRFKTRLTNGTETLTDRVGGGIVRVFAPIPTALHGDTADLIMFDEAWSIDVDRGDELEVAAFPLMATRPGAQLWALTAAGDVDSTWWARWLERGRAAAAADIGTGHAHFEWTADGTDPATWGDETVWLESHPGIRHPDNPAGVVLLPFLRREYERDPDQFARSYLNVTDRTGTTSSPIDADTWSALDGPAPDRTDETIIALGVAVGVEQSSAAIVAAFVDDAGVATLEVIDYRPGYLWVVDRVVDIVDRYGATVAIDGGGSSPSAVLVTPLTRAGCAPVSLDLAGAGAAAADLVAAVRAGTVRHVPHPALDAAVAGARRRYVGDGAWLFGRRDADHDAAPLEAAAIARWTHPDVHGASFASIR